MNVLDTRLHAVRPDLADLALKGLVEAERFVAGERVRIVAPAAPVRRAPSADAMLLTEALCGEALTVFDTVREGWAWAQLANDRYVGWIPQDVLSATAPAPTHKVSALRTPVFSRPDIKAPPLAFLSLGAEVALTGEAEDHNAGYGLVAPAGAVAMQHLAPLAAFEDDWVAVAERFAGTPYLWGGKTSLGIDCSGLIQTALRSAGCFAQRDTDMQEAALGATLPLDGGLPPLRRGDIVFWRGHAGIMLDAQTLLHANAHHMAVASESLQAARTRLEGRGLPISSIRRIGAA